MCSMWGFAAILLVISISEVESRSDCQTPDKEAGRCIKIKDCPSLLKLVEKQPLPTASVEFLRKSHCGFSSDEPQVCCSDPPPCTTQGRNSGTCISIRRCPLMFSVLNGPQPVPPTAIAYMRNSVCEGLESNTVCCGDLQLPTPQPPSPPQPASVCGVSSTEERVHGGTEAPIDALPWLAMIEYEPKRKGRPNQLLCGASLIHPRFVLTAAHCLVGDRVQEKPVNVRLGEHNTETEIDCQRISGGGEDCNDPLVIIPIKSFTTHEQYLPRARNRLHDIAIIKLAEAAPYTDFIRHICLPTVDITQTISSNEVNFTVGGWGATENNSFSSTVKLMTDVPFKSLSECQSAYSNYNLQLKDRHICAGGEGGRDTCNGDSGTPLMLRDPDTSIYQVHGVVSFGDSDCGTHRPGIYTKVYNYLDWIRMQMRS